MNYPLGETGLAPPHNEDREAPIAQRFHTAMTKSRWLNITVEGVEMKASVLSLDGVPDGHQARLWITWGGEPKQT